MSTEACSYRCSEFGFKFSALRLLLFTPTEQKRRLQILGCYCSSSLSELNGLLDISTFAFPPFFMYALSSLLSTCKKLPMFNPCGTSVVGKPFAVPVAAVGNACNLDPFCIGNFLQSFQNLMSLRRAAQRSHLRGWCSAHWKHGSGMPCFAVNWNDSHTKISRENLHTLTSGR